MSQRTFQQSINIHASRDAIFTALCDLDNRTGLHPLIVAVEHVGSSNDSDEYIITDRIRVLGIPYTFKYRAVLRPEPPARLHTSAIQALTTLEAIFELQEQANATVVQETTTIHAPWWLMGFVYRQAYDSHHESLLRLKTWCERS